jgi:hypothetical protein
MLGRHMKTTYLPNNRNNTNVTVSSMGDENGFSVMLINRSKSAGFNYSLSFNGAYGSVQPLRISVQTGLEKEMTGHIEKVTTQMLVFDAEGFLVRKYTYSEEHANNYMGPTVTDYSSPSATQGSLRFISPVHGIKYKTNDELVVDVEAIHPDGIDSVSLYINNTYVGMLSKAPFVWNETDSLLADLEPGYYDLRSIAYLANGDSITTAISFNIILSFAPAEPIPVPGIVQAEFYSDMFGIQTEVTTDTGGGRNVGYFDVGDWLDYSVDVATAGKYAVVFRVAGWQSSGRVALRNAAGTNLTAANIPNTGGYQVWRSVAGESSFNLAAGEQIIRIYALGSPFNINYFEIIPFDDTSTGELTNDNVKIFPVPVIDQLHLQGLGQFDAIRLFNNKGQLLWDMSVTNEDTRTIDMTHHAAGIYYLGFSNSLESMIRKVVKY